MATTELVNPPLESTFSAGARFVQWHESSLQSVRTSLQVALFTPADPQILAAIAAGLASIENDSFVYLGKRILLHATGVAHVPYLPQIGLTNTHIRLMGDAAVIIIVMCRPDKTEDTAAATSIRDQMIFTKDVAALCGQRKLCCIQCDVINYGMNRKYTNVIWSKTYEACDLELVADLLFGKQNHGH